VKDDDYINEVFEAIGELKPKRKDGGNTVGVVQFKLGEVMANGVRYFGMETVVKGDRTAMCICPRCGELWRVCVKYIIGGKTLSCGCKK